MRLLILLMALAAPGWAGYGYYIHYTPAASQVDNGPHTDFPVLIDTTHNDLRTTGNGGFVTDTQGDDIVPHTDAACSSPITAFDFIAYDGTTGRIRMHVNISSLSSSSNLYLCFGNAAITTPQGTATSTWNSGFAAVYHMGDGSTCGVSDATGNSLTLTNTGTVNGTTGKVYGACGTNWSNTVYLSRASAASLVFSGSWTISAWINVPSCGAYPQVVFKGAAATRNYELDLGNYDCKPRANMTQSAVEKNATAAGAVSTGTWTHIAGRYNGSAVQVFRNGVSDGSTATTGSPDTDTNTLKVGVFETAGIYSNPWVGTLDEVRISNVARSDGWLVTETNAGTPSTFWTVGSPTAVSSTRRRVIVIQ